MLYSISFAIFFLIVFVLYWQLPKKYQLKLLLFASYYFYLSWKPVYGLLIVITTLVTYYSALYIEKFPFKKNGIFFLSLLIILGQLFLFKYFNLFSFTTSSLLVLAKIPFELPQFKLLLPLGISFFTFQTLGYLIDVYRGHAKAERNFGILALFVSFFPTISSGPIERSWHLISQFQKKQVFTYSQTVSGLKLFTWGLFKKLVVADNLGIIVSRVFDNLPDYKGLSLLLAMFFFSIQIFADFSGYTDMARGVARMLGFSLFENFKTPYLSTSIRDFWRRWHISLSSWLKDYVYIPLGGSRKGEIRTYINTIIVFVLCGFWHGASWTFAIWGFAHGLMISVERILGKLFSKKITLPNGIGIFYSFFVITALWVLFRAKNIADALYIYRYSFTGLKYFISPQYWWATLSQLFKTNVVEMLIALFCVIVIVITELMSSQGSLSQFVGQHKKIIRFIIYSALLLSIILLRNSEAFEFIYVQF